MQNESLPIQYTVCEERGRGEERGEEGEGEEETVRGERRKDLIFY